MAKPYRSPNSQYPFPATASKRNAALSSKEPVCLQLMYRRNTLKRLIPTTILTTLAPAPAPLATPSCYEHSLEMTKPVIFAVVGEHIGELKATHKPCKNRV